MDHIVADAKVLSMAAILIGKLKQVFDSSICLIRMECKGSDDIIVDANARQAGDKGSQRK